MNKPTAKLSVFGLVFIFILSVFALNVSAKAFAIQNESVNMFVVNGTLALFIGLSLLALIKNIKEIKTEFHNPVLVAESAIVPRRSVKETFKYKKLSVLDSDLSKSGVAQSGTAADSESASFHDMRVRNLGFESKSEVPSSSAQKSIPLFALVLFSLVFIIALVPNVNAKVYVIQNESVNQFVVNGSSGNIILNPNAGFGSVGIFTNVHRLPHTNSAAIVTNVPRFSTKTIGTTNKVVIL